MTLVEALQKHMGCVHRLRTVGPGRVHHIVKAVEPDKDDEVVTYSGSWHQDDPVQRGSAAFHDLARWLLSLPGHSRHPLHITDEEYAGFVDAVR